jgi:peptidase E
LEELPRRPAPATVVPTASNRLDGAPRVGTAERALTSLGLRVEEFDLEGAAPSAVEACSATTDLVFVTGGHTLFLLEHALRSGFSSIVPEAVRAGRLAYAGMSLGGFLAGPDLLYCMEPSDPGRPGPLLSPRGPTGLTRRRGSAPPSGPLAALASGWNSST